MAQRISTPQPNVVCNQPVDYYVPTAEYTQRPPSPPFIHIPAHNTATDRMELSAPTELDGVDIGVLSPEEFTLVTGSGSLQRGFVTDQWHYELRRQAQPILDFLFLGPSSVARDVGFLSKNGITMVLGARDARLAAVRLNRIEQEVSKLGIEIKYVDVGTPASLIRSFSDATTIINKHLVSVYRRQQEKMSHSTTNAPAPADTDGSMMDVDGVTSAGGPRKGKILVFCETGNDRSAAVVAAYIMAVYRVDIIKAAQFVQSSRFCTSFDEETKQMLTTYQELLEARRQIARDVGSMSSLVTTPRPCESAGPSPSPFSASSFAPHKHYTTQTPSFIKSSNSSPPFPLENLPIYAAKHAKRSYFETMDDDEIATNDMNGTGDMDRERYLGRSFAPFIDHQIAGCSGSSLNRNAPGT